MSVPVNPRKHRADSFTIDEDSVDLLPLAKRAKESTVSDTSSEESSQDDRLSRMSQAIKTLIEVINYYIILYDNYKTQ